MRDRKIRVVAYGIVCAVTDDEHSKELKNELFVGLGVCAFCAIAIIWAGF